MPAVTPDPLALVADRLRGWAAEQTLPVLTGTVTERGALPIVDLTAPPSVGPAMAADEVETLVAALTAAAAGARPTLVLLELETLTQAEYEEAVAVLTARDAPGELLGRATACRKHVGQVGALYLEVIAAAPPLVLRWAREAPWYDVMYGPESLVPAREDPEAAAEAAARAAARAADERERALWTARKRTEAAERLYADAQFAKARTEQMRIVLLRRVLGDAVPADAELQRQIVREAHAMLELDATRAPR